LTALSVALRAQGYKASADEALAAAQAALAAY